MISVRTAKRCLGGAGATLLICGPRSASANGRFPGADQLVVDPSDPLHLVVRATFGFVDSRDRGASWSWICEDVVGPIGASDPPVAVSGDGTLVVGVPFHGVVTSHDHGCTWTPAPAELAQDLVVDLTRDPSDASAIYALASTNDPTADGGLEFDNRVFLTRDGARTWERIATLPRDLVATTIEVAPSDATRIYVSGIAGDPPLQVLERSSDGGRTWNATSVPGPTPPVGLFIAAVDPGNPDRLWLRVLTGSPDAFGMAPTTLRVSDDGGTSWKDLVSTPGAMLGFALSPDGSFLAYGGQQEGVHVGPSDGRAGFARVSDTRNRCLTWSGPSLYACATEPYDPFAVARSDDGGQSFVPTYKLADTCPQACGEDTAFARSCRATWTDPVNGVAMLIGASGQSCSVPWAAVGARDAGTDVATGDATQVDAGSSIEAAGGCSCSVPRTRAGRASLWAIAIALGLLRRRAVK